MTDLLIMQGFDEAILGQARRFNIEFVVYDYEKVIEILMRDMSEDEAIEYFEYNQVGAWVGEGTPAFLMSKTLEDNNAHDSN